MVDNEDEIIEALENSASNRKARGSIGDPVVPDRQDNLNWRDRLLRFFDDLGDDLTVGEIRQVLEDYNG